MTEPTLYPMDHLMMQLIGFANGKCHPDAIWLRSMLVQILLDSKAQPSLLRLAQKGWIEKKGEFPVFTNAGKAKYAETTTPFRLLLETRGTSWVQSYELVRIHQLLQAEICRRTETSDKFREKMSEYMYSDGYVDGINCFNDMLLSLDGVKLAADS